MGHDNAASSAVGHALAVRTHWASLSPAPVSTIRGPSPVIATGSLRTAPHAFLASRAPDGGDAAARPMGCVTPESEEWAVRATWHA
jgi:hypothetical protein